MTPEDMKQRTKQFALRLIRLVESLPSKASSQVIGRQLPRAGTSVGANYRAACRARSRAEFLAKLGVVEEEADETCYWMELLTEAKLMSRERVSALMKEGNEIAAMVVSSIRTLRAKAGRAECNPKSQIPNPKSEIPNPK
jgi:four helix bundle protein